MDADDPGLVALLGGGLPIPESVADAVNPILAMDLLPDTAMAQRASEALRRGPVLCSSCGGACACYPNGYADAAWYIAEGKCRGCGHPDHPSGYCQHPKGAGFCGCAGLCEAPAVSRESVVSVPPSDEERKALAKWVGERALDEEVGSGETPRSVRLRRIEEILLGSR